MAKENEATETRRVTVLFNLKHWARLERELARREKEAGYPVTVSDLLRSLVDEGVPE